jgi:hypothetical protein
MYDINCFAAGSICAAGIWLLGNACPVLGSTSANELWEKSPRRIASSGTVAYWSNTTLDWLPV